MKERKDWVLIALVLFITIGLFYILNYIIPFFGDDFFSKYHIRTGKYLDSFPKMLDSAVCSWSDFIGRLIPAIIMPIITVFLGEQFYNVFNTFLLLAICLLLLKVSKTNLNEKGILTTCIIIFALFFCLNNNDLLFWCAGSVNYLIPSLFILLFFDLFDRFKNQNVNIAKGFAFMTCGIFIASLHEMYACAIAIGLFIYFLLYRKSLSSAFWWMTIGWLVGSCIVILNPALFAKFRYEESIGGMWFIHSMVKFLVSIKITYILLILTVILYIKKKEAIINAYRQHPLIVLSFIPSSFPALISGQGGRALWGTEFLALLIIIILLQQIYISKTKCYCIGLFLFICCCYLEIHQIQEYTPKWQEYKRITQQYLNSKKSLVTYQDIRTSSLCRLFSDDLNEILDEQIYLLPLKKEKERQTQKRQRIMTAVPNNIFQQAIMGHASFFSKNKASKNLLGFYDQKDFAFMIQPYNSILLNKIGNERLYAEYRIKYFPFIKLRVNYCKGDLLKPRPVLLVKTKEYGNYILLNKQYKHFPFTELIKLGIRENQPTSKFELI